jgi:hypothetical protein
MRPGWWPVFGPRHEDGELLGFPWQHYHFDPRFLTNKQIKNRTRYRLLGKEEIFGIPLTDHGASSAEHIRQFAPDHLKEHKHIAAVPLPPPEYRRLRCKRRMPEYTNPALAVKLEPHFYGRTLKSCKVCPHRGLPLASLPVGEDGLVVCPGHGLRWDAKTGELAQVHVTSPHLEEDDAD